MNNVVLIGRLTKDPEVRRVDEKMAIATFSLAIDRPVKKDGEKKTDFPRVTVFGRQAESCEKYLAKGMLVGIQGSIQTGSYTNKDGQRVYTTDVVVEEQEFAESKAVSDSHVNRSASQPAAPDMADSSAEGFMNIPDEIGGELPF